jgi:hypothetical protein
MNASIGTPAGLSQSSSSAGLLVAATVKRAFGWAAFAPVSFAIAGVQSLPCQSIRCAGGVGHAFPPDVAVVGQRDVREDHVVLQAGHAVVVGLVVGAGRHAEVAGLRVDRVEPAVRFGLIQAMSSPIVVTFQPSMPAAGSASRSWSFRRRSGTPRRHGACGLGEVTPRISMCSASQPWSRPIVEAMRSAKHFLPSSALPP